MKNAQRLQTVWSRFLKGIKNHFKVDKIIPLILFKGIIIIIQMLN